MNRKELELRRRTNLNKLDTAFRPKINAIEIDINNSFRHEFAKFWCVWMVRKNGIEAKILPEYFHPNDSVTDMIFEVEKEKDEFGDFRKFKHEWERPQVITEARFKKNIKINPDDLMVENLMRLHNQKQRRIDIFILDTGEIVEIETDKKVNKEGAITVYV